MKGGVVGAPSIEQGHRSPCLQRWALGGLILWIAIALAQPVRADLIHHYPLDGNANDAAGTAHGTPQGGVGYDAANKVGGTSSLLLDGVNDAVLLGAVSYPTTAFTISAWARYDGSASDMKTIWANGTIDALGNGYKLFINAWATTDKRIFIESGNGSGGAVTATALNTYVTDGQFHHIVATINRSAGVGHIYYDGALLGTGTVHTGGGVSGLNAYIGQTNSVSYPMRFKGNIDELQIYNSVLTPAEITFLRSNPSQTLAAATPDISVGSAESFATTAVGSTSTSTFTIANSGNFVLNVSSIALSGADVGEFSLGYDTCLVANPTVAASGSCTVQVTFAPTSNGTKSATLTILSDDDDEASVTVPLSALAGSSEPIPTLSEWGLLMMACLLLGTMLVAQQRSSTRGN